MTQPPSARELDHGAQYRAVCSKDPRFDGVFYTAVRTTGIYCRPSCPARTPAPGNVEFFPSAAAAQGAGFRACKRCLPDATPGSAEWDVTADVAGRAMRLIGDGVVDREGVGGLARRLGYTERHLTRLLTSSLGAGPLALARARRAQTARALIEASELAFTDIAYAAGFASVRQFNDTIREVYATTPSDLRGHHAGHSGGQLTLRLGVRTPFAGRALLDFLRVRAVPGIETADAHSYARTLRLPHGPAVVRVWLTDEPEVGRATVRAQFALHDQRDLTAAVERVRRLLDADADPAAIAEDLSPDRLLGPLLGRWPGLRVPGHVDGDELAVRGVLGQQITLAAARTLTSRLVSSHGDELPPELRQEGLTHLFPTSASIATLEPTGLGMPEARARALRGLTSALTNGEVILDRSRPRPEVRERLLALTGIGPWTADYVALRGLADPDVFMNTDSGVRAALRRLGCTDDPLQRAERWRPWRSYAQAYLWQSLTTPEQGAPPCGP